MGDTDDETGEFICATGDDTGRSSEDYTHWHIIAAPPGDK